MSEARRLFAALYRDQPRRMSVVLALMVVLSLTETVGLLLLVPLLGLVGLDVGEGSVGHVTDAVSEVFAALGLSPSLAAVLAVYVCVVGIRQALGVWEGASVARLEQDFANRLRRRLYRATMSVPWMHFSRGRRSDAIQLLTTEMDRVSAAVSQVPRLLSLALLAVTYTALAAFVSPSLTAVAAGCGIIIMLAMRGWNGRAERRGRLASHLAAEMQARATEDLRGLKTVRSHGAEERSISQFARLGDRVADNWARTSRDYAMASGLFGLSTAAVLSVIVWVAMARLALPAATILLCLYLFARLVPRFNALQTNWQFLRNALPAYRNVSERLAWCEAHARPSLGPSQDVVFDRELELRGVTFGYPASGESAAVADLSIRVRAGEMVALIGRSGAGKSTVADLILGLLEPTAGLVLVDGRPITQHNAAAWRRRIGYVPQRTFLLNDTVAANLEWGTPEASEGEMWEALRLAGADGFVHHLPGGLDMIVGDQGALLSGGERQRLALARALLRQPDLLILDEPTSALDYENERRILDTLRGFGGNMAILVITHRLRAAHRADRIYVLERGRIAEAGSWSELLGARGGMLAGLLQAEAAGAAKQPEIEVA